MLTKRQKQILEYIKKFIKEKGYSPSLEDIRRHFRLSSKSTIHQHLETLKEKGYISKSENLARGIEIPKRQKQDGLTSIPLLGIIAAGEPIEAIENPDTVEVAKDQLSKTAEHFALQVGGNSMIEEGIFDGDVVVIKKQATAENGETVVALLNDNEVTLKKIYREKSGFRLQPANPKLKPIYTKELQVQGKVVSIIRNFEQLQALASRKEIRDLQTTDLKQVFQEIRDYLAGNARGMTRDETLVPEMMKLLFCKVYDELHVSRKQTPPMLVVQPGETNVDLKNRLNNFFAKEVKQHYGDIFQTGETIRLDPESLSYVIQRLEPYSLLNANRDAVGDAFEAFFGPSLRGSEGQFFTPKNVVKMMIEIINPHAGEIILDPACGSGGFLIEALSHIASGNTTSKTRTSARIASKSIYGIDKDEFLTKITKAYMSIMGDGKSNIFCEDSLEKPRNWSKATQQKVPLEKFDIVITNPPFGAKIPISGEKLRQYDLGFSWEKTATGWEKTDKLLDKQPPQILFIERCLQFLTRGGRLGIVLPEGIFGNPSERYIWEHLFSNTKLLAIISVPQETFQPSTHTKTSILVLEKGVPTKDYSVFMAIASKVGHDKNGKPLFKASTSSGAKTKVLDDELPIIAKNYLAQRRKNSLRQQYSQLGFWIQFSEIKEKKILIPEYYNPAIKKRLSRLEKSGEFVLTSFGELLEQGVVSISRGYEIGSQHYNTGDIPFVRTSDITNWEIKIDPIKCISEEVYERYRKRQDIQTGDILFVNDGTFLIGRTAMVNDFNKKILIQSHLKKIRVNPNSFIDNFLLFYLLNTDVVREQIKAKTFVQATISTIGDRINEVVLPVPKTATKRNKISNSMSALLAEKEDLARRCRDFVLV